MSFRSCPGRVNPAASASADWASVSGARVQDRFAEALLQTLIEVGPKVVNEEPEYGSRVSLMWAATMVLNGLITTSSPHWTAGFIGLSLPS